MTEAKTGFHLRYTSAKALERDHSAYLKAGEIAIAWPGGMTPASVDPFMVKVEAPDGTIFELRGKMDRPWQKKGFILKMDTPPPADRARAVLDMFVRGDRFKRMVAAERALAVDPQVTMIGDIEMIEPEEATDPGAGLAAEAETEAIDEEGLGRMIDALDQDTLSGGDGEDGDDDDGTDGGDGDPGAEFSAVDAMPPGFTKPGPGTEYLVYVVKYQRVTDFAVIKDSFRQTQRLELEHQEEPARKGGLVQLRLTLPGHNVYNMFGFVANLTADRVILQFDENNEKFRQACLYMEQPAARNRMKTEDPNEKLKPQVIRLIEVVPEDDPEKMPIRRRLQRMGMEDKINLALSGGREERMALAMDSNKAIPHYLLRNARISLDEIAFMARLPTMNPDVLDKIAENPQYTQNPTVVKALVYNPKTPTPTAIRLLDRLPRSEVMSLAKRTNLNMRLVMAAKKKIEGKRW